jgi:hypothetical protein
MKQEKPAKILKALAVMLLCFPFPLGRSQAKISFKVMLPPYWRREFRIKNFSLDVAGETVRIKSAEVAAADHDEVMAALLSIHGVKRVTIVDSLGAVVASSTPQETGTQRAAAQKPTKPDYELGFFPAGNLLEPLIADPRWLRFSMGYRYFTDEATNVASATFGETIALYRARIPSGGFAEIGFQAGVFSIFDLDAPSTDLVNTDFFAALQATYRMNDFSTFFRIFHQSSHLGDEFLLRNRIDRANLSFEGVNLILSYRPFDWLRLYGGGAYLFDLDPPGIKPWATQAGIELQTPWRFGGDSTRLVTALDLQTWQENKWSTEISIRGGFQFERPQSFMRKISLLPEFYKGHSPNGQLFNRKFEYFGPRLYLDF